MEEDRDFNSSTSSCCNQEVARGQRTKRRRTRPPPLALLGPTTTTTSSASSAEFSSSVTEEDEDMANCLVVLSRGRSCTLPIVSPGPSLYECRTCSKRFPSFQALGGHCASHKRPKLTPSPEEITSSDFSKHSDKSKVHECAMCGMEFSSGQALGGHMRRHRPIVAVAAAALAPEITSKERISVIPLDLNLPAPDDDDHGRQQLGFAIVDDQQQIVFSAAAPLVDCQY